MALIDVRIAVLVSNGFDSMDFDTPVQELKNAGASVEVLASTSEQMQDGIESISGALPTEKIMPDLLIHRADPALYQGLLIPGGVLSVDRLRLSNFHAAFVRRIAEEGRPIGAIGHAAWLLADAGIAQGKTMTSWPTIRRDLERAGAIWKDQRFVEDQNLITAQGGGADLTDFSNAFVRLLEKTYRHRPAAA